MDAPLFDLQDAAFAYPETSGPALDGVTLRIGRGESVALLGPNGAGKSTLVRLLAGLLIPTRGAVLLEGCPVHGFGRRSLARRVAVLPQRLQTAFDADVEDVVALGRTAHRSPLTGWWSSARGDGAAVETALRLTDTARFRGRSVQSLSGGEQQRVALALALAQEADVLLLDEPTSHLDPYQAQAVLDLVAAVRRERSLTVVAVFHDVNLAALYAARVLLLHRGRLVADGAPADVVRAGVLDGPFGPCLRFVDHPDSRLPQVLPRGDAHDSRR